MSSDVTSRIIDTRAERTANGAHRLLGAGAVRDSAHRMLTLALARDPRLHDWVVHLDGLDTTADYVTRIVRDSYPTLIVPVHSRWRHFVFGGHDLWGSIAARAGWQDPYATARAAFDLVILSVLLDAGAGPEWRFEDGLTGAHATRSEGLALASLRWFENGGLSDRSSDPARVDGAALCRVDSAAICSAFQARDGNQLLGVAGRAALLNRLGTAIESRPDLFALEDSPRPGGLFDALRARAQHGRLPAAAILEILLEALGPIWQGRPELNGIPLGDCWPHPALAGARPEDGYAALHKLSQWLAYSLIEPLEIAGITVTDVHELTGLAEYRNGGLFVDMGVLVPRDPAALSITYAVSDAFVVAWRSLTVALLDRLAPLIAARLGLTQEQFPLASALEGGTWAAGRLIARARRAAGGPPFHVSSDGTVF